MNASSETSWFKKPIVWIAALAVVAVVVGMSIWSWTNTIKNEGNTWQVKVVQQYNNYQVSLSTCIDNTRLGAKIADEQFEQIKDILVGAVSARYVDANGNSTNASTALGGGQLISALAEQYPDIDTTVWQQLMTNAIGCRNQAMGEAQELQSVAARFNQWLVTGGVFSRQIRDNWPTDGLQVTGLNGQMLTGQSALAFITQPVLTSDAIKAFETHVMPDQSKDLFGDE